MRVGKNPNKLNKLIENDYSHQIIIPVYIPNQEGYFKDSFKILQYCLESLFKTCHSKTFITIVNNGSSVEISGYLNRLFDDKKIHEVIHTTNFGKINAILKGCAGHRIKWVTIADADVLFLSGWQKETFNVFKTFPKAGVVGVVPQFKSYSDLSSNVLFDYFLSEKMKFGDVLNPEALKMFYKSIGWDNYYNQDMLKVNLKIYDNKGHKAVVGSGHFVATYKRQILDNLPSKASNTKMGRDLRLFIDALVLRKGGYRLTTDDNYAYHMGNVLEPWMQDVIHDLKKEDHIIEWSLNEGKFLKQSYIGHIIKNQLFRKLLEYKPFINWFTRFKGLPSEMSKTPWHV